MADVGAANLAPRICHRARDLQYSHSSDLLFNLGITPSLAVRPTCCILLLRASHVAGITRPLCVHRVCAVYQSLSCGHHRTRYGLLWTISCQHWATPYRTRDSLALSAVPSPAIRRTSGQFL